MLDKIIDWLIEHWILIITLFIILVTLIFIFGCQSETQSLVLANEKVTRSQLLDEFQLLKLKFTRRIEELDQQDTIRDMILQQSMLIAQTGTVNPIGLVTSLLAILGIGATADDVRLRKLRKKTLTLEPTNDKT